MLQLYMGVVVNRDIRRMGHHQFNHTIYRPKKTAGTAKSIYGDGSTSKYATIINQ
jgi:hypothetical protein